MTIPAKYRKSPPFIASYNWTDISNGTGVSAFYGGEMSDSAANTFALSANSFYSNTVTTKTAAFTDQSFAKKIDQDYDIELNLPKTINGKILINATVGMKDNASGNTTNVQYYIIAKLRKWDGTTETDLDSNQTETITTSLSSNAVTDHTFATEIDVDKEKFAAGETIRITIEVWALRVSGWSTFAVLGHDPQNRDDPNNIIDSASPTILKVDIPFMLE